MLSKSKRREFRYALAGTCGEIGFHYYESRKRKTITISSRKRYLPRFGIHWEDGCYRVKVYLNGKRVDKHKSQWALNTEQKLMAFPKLLRLWVMMRPGRRKGKAKDR